MKKILSIFAFLIAFTSIQVNAQKLLLKNSDEQISHVLKTVDSNYHFIDSTTINTNETGIVEVAVLGLDTANVYAVTGVIKARYVSSSGTITLGSIISDVPIVSDSGISPGTFNFYVSGSKIYVRVKGELNTAVHWYSTFKRKAIYKR